jgi:hypothetical protein
MPFPLVPPLFAVRLTHGLLLQTAEAAVTPEVPPKVGFAFMAVAMLLASTAGET